MMKYLDKYNKNSNNVRSIRTHGTKVFNFVLKVHTTRHLTAKGNGAIISAPMDGD